MKKQSVSMNISKWTLYVLVIIDLFVGSMTAAALDSATDMQQWLANRYPPGSLQQVVTGNLGNTYDCVIRSRQPALERVDGTFAPIAKPPVAPQNARALELSSGEARAQPETITCPAGTVPMMHVDMQTLLRFGSLQAFFHKESEDLSAARLGATNQHQYAKVDQVANNWGGDAVFNLWNPYVELNTEFSLSQIWVVRGTGSNKQTLESGWVDYPNLTGDQEPHLFVFSTQDGYVNTGCWNGTCGDFVQYSPTITPSIGFTNTSINGGTQYIIQLRWQRDNSNNNWWLMYGTTWVGYYPGTLFDAVGVRDMAERVSYGGEIIDNNPVAHTRTDMGSGGLPPAGWTYAAYTRTLRTISIANVWQPASTATEFRTDPLCYDVALYTAAGAWANYFYFGGEGLGPNCQ